MSFVRLVAPEQSHIASIAERMREWDRIEAGAVGHSPRSALRLGMAGSVDCFTVMIDGEPEAMLGLMPKNTLEGEGSPWLLGTEAVYRNPKAMIALAPRVFAMWSDSTPHLSGLVALGNVPAIRLLRRWGTVGEERKTMGGVEFVTFTIGNR